MVIPPSIRVQLLPVPALQVSDIIESTGSLERAPIELADPSCNKRRRKLRLSHTSNTAADADNMALSKVLDQVLASEVDASTL